MAYDPKLADRTAAALREWPHVTARNMFGGVGWLLRGHLLAAIWRDSLVIRCGPVVWPDLLRRRHVREFDITGRSMRGWILVDPPALRTAAALRRWLEHARTYVDQLPPK